MGASGGAIKNDKGDLIFYDIDKTHKKFELDKKYSLQDFEIMKTLGSGYFGEVFLVKYNKNQKYYAMKKLNLKKNKGADIYKEIKLLENLDHPHIIHYFTSFIEDNFWYIVVEFMNGKNLQDLIKENIKNKKYMEPKKVCDLLIQCLSGLAYLHKEKKIIHRDIKPDNLLLDLDFNLKISDFGVSAIDSFNIDIEDILKFHNSFAGPISFVAPEVLEQKKYDFKSDIYMLGLTFFLLTSNEYYITRINKGKIISTNTGAKIGNMYPPDLKKLILSFLETQELRPKAEDAFNEALYIYTIKYLQVTSIMALFFCFFRLIEKMDYFKNEQIINDIKLNQNNKYIFAKASFDILNYCNISNFNQELLEQESKKLRFLYDKEKYDINRSLEIDLFDFIKFLLNKLNDELKPDVLHNAERPFYIINDNFFYTTKLVYQCFNCNNIIKENPKSDSICILHPGKSKNYLKKFDININDLFEYSRKRRKYSNKSEKVYCDFCKLSPDKVYKTNIFYTLPPNLIIQLDCYDEGFNLIIEENIDIKDFIERNDICRSTYKLIGAIFFEYNDNREKVYKSITKNQNNKWLLFNGTNIYLSNIDEIKKNKNIKYLFYTNLE